LRPHPLAKRYARALFELAIEKNQLEQMLAEMHQFADLLEQNKRLNAYFYSPEIEKDRKIEILQNLLQNKVSDLFLNFLFLIMRKGRENYYPEMTFEFDRLYDIHNNRLRVKIISAVPLSEAELAKAKELLSQSLKAELILENKVDADILGGLIVQINGKVIDGSLKHQLDVLRRELKKKETLAA